MSDIEIAIEIDDLRFAGPLAALFTSIGGQVVVPTPPTPIPSPTSGPSSFSYLAAIAVATGAGGMLEGHQVIFL